MKIISFVNHYPIIVWLCLTIQSGDLLAAWKNLCPDNMRCTAETFFYGGPGEISHSNGVTLPYFSFWDNALAEDKKHITTRLIAYPDRVEAPEWDAQIQPGGAFLQLTNGNWVTMQGMDQTFTLDPAGTQLHYQDHRTPLNIGISILGPIMEDKDTVLYSNNGFLFSSTDAGVTWTETRNWNGLIPLGICKNPFGSGFYATGLVASSDGQRKYGIFNIFTDGTWHQIDDLNPVSSFDTAIISLAFDHKPKAHKFPTIYAATSNGILVSRDKGRSWSQLDGLETIVHSLAVVDDHEPKLIIASTDDAGILASKDQGKTWKPFAQGLLDGKREVNNPLIHPVIYYLNGQLLARTQGGWYRCSDFDCEGDMIIPPAPTSRYEVMSSVIEFYNSTLDHYFITSDNDEIAAIDAGQAGSSWSRTGFTFTAWAPLGLNTGKVVCRFYGSTSPGPNSHFFSASADECDALHQLQKSTPAEKPRWNFEGLPFMVAKGRVANAEACAEGHIPIYRAYNNGYARGVDSNHRFVADHAEIDKLVAKGWADEGIAFCALP